MEELCQKMIDEHRDLAPYNDLAVRIRKYKVCMEKDFLTHLETTSTVASHCIRRLTCGQQHDFGATCDGCGAPGGAPCKVCDARAEFATDCPESCGQHADHCQQCDERCRIFAELRAMLAFLEVKGASDIHSDFAQQIIKAEKYVDKYIGHRVRTHIEDVASRARHAGHSFYDARMTRDFKMKWTAMVGGVFRVKIRTFNSAAALRRCAAVFSGNPTL